MNRLLYFMPIASIPLLALAQQSAGRPTGSDNPWIAIALTFIVSLAIAIGIVRYFRLGTRGRIAAAVIFGAVDWIVTASFGLSAVGGLYPGMSIAMISSALLAYLIIRHDRGLALLRRSADARQVRD